MNNSLYISPIVGGPVTNAAYDDKCITGQKCSTGFAAIVIIGGGVLVAVAVYCPPAVIEATLVAA